MVQQQLDSTFSALSDANRRSILERLGSGPATISELAEPLEMTLTGVKKHVAVLEGAGLVITEKRGRSRSCRLGSERLDEASDWIDSYRRGLEARLDRLGEYLDATNPTEGDE